jgi:hypothetical protein
MASNTSTRSAYAAPSSSSGIATAEVISALIKEPMLVTLSKAAWQAFLPLFKQYTRKGGKTHLCELIDINLHSTILLRSKTKGVLTDLSDNEVMGLIQKIFLPADSHETIFLLSQIRMSDSRQLSEDQLCEYVNSYELILKDLPRELIPREKRVVKQFIAGIDNKLVRSNLLELELDSFAEAREESLVIVRDILVAQKRLRMNVSSDPTATNFHRHGDSNSLFNVNHSFVSGASGSTAVHHNRGRHQDSGSQVKQQSQTSSASGHSQSHGGHGNSFRPSRSSSTPPATSTTSTLPTANGTPPSGYVCKLCNKPGHFVRDCVLASTNGKKVAILQIDHSDGDEIGNIPPKNVLVITDGGKAATDVNCDIPVLVSGVGDSASCTPLSTTAFADTGADVPIVNSSMADQLRSMGHKFADVMPPMKIKTASGSSIVLSKKVRLCLDLTIQGRKMKMIDDYYEMSSCPHRLLLSKDIIVNSGVLSWLGSQCDPPACPDEEDAISDCDDPKDDVQIPKPFQSLTDRYPRLFSAVLPPGGANFPPLVLKIYSNSKPVVIPPRQLSPIRLAATREIVQARLDEGLIVSSTSSYSSPLHLVVRKPGPPPTYRATVDYSGGLNDQLLPIQFPLPNNRKQIESLRGYSLFSKIDCRDFFFQFPLAPESRYLTAFSTPDGLFEYLVVPQGLKVASQWAQYQITLLLNDLLAFCVVFIDDLVVMATTMDELVDNTDKILSRLDRANIRVNLSKCSFGVSSVTHLGFTVNGNGFELSEARRDAIANIPIPATVKQLHSFLGLMNFFRQFVANFAVKTKFLYEVLNSKSPDLRSAAFVEAIKLVQSDVVNATLLHHIDYSAKIVVRTDASTKGIGAVLLNVIAGVEHCVAYISKAFDSTQARWATIEQEGYALFYALVKWESYLLGHPFEIHCDHRNLVFLYKSLTPKIIRWRLRIQEFDYTIVHIAGTSNVLADALSRVCTVSKVSKDAIASVHNALVGHYGLQETIARLPANSNITNAEVKEFISSCVTCQKHAADKMVSHGVPFTNMVDRFNHTISIDTQEYPSDDNGYTYVIAIVCLFSRFILLFRAKTRDTTVAAYALLKWFCLFGAPVTVSSDQGGQFVNGVLADFFRLIGTSHKLGIAYHHQHQGAVERSLREVLRHLAAIVYDCRVKMTWSDYLPLVQRILNQHVSTVTGHSPNAIVFGNLVNTNDGLLTSRLPPVDNNNNAASPTSFGEYVKGLIKAQALITASSQLHQKEWLYSKNENWKKNGKKETIFAVGQFVLIRWPDNKQADKLSPKFRGPFEVKAILPNSEYLVKNLVLQTEEKLHVSKILPYNVDSSSNSNPLLEASKDIDEWIVHSIVDHRPKPLPRNLKTRQFLVKFQGFDDSSNEWINYMDVRDTEAYQAYMLKLQTQ